MHRPILSLLAACLVCAGPARVVAQFPDDRPAKKKDTTPVDPAKAIQKIDGDRFKCGLIEFNQKTREIRIPSRIAIREGPLEYVLVHETGKFHESLFTTDVRPIELNIVMLLLNWKKSEAFFDFSEPERGGVLVKNANNPPVSQVEVFVEWKDKDGKTQTCRTENWMHQIEKRAKVTDGPWIYTGSLIMPNGSFFAEDSGSILALYQDAGAMINNPREGNDLDDVWIADPEVPAKDTPVTVIFKPAGAADGEKNSGDKEKKEDKEQKKEVNKAAAPGASKTEPPSKSGTPPANPPAKKKKP